MPPSWTGSRYPTPKRGEVRAGSRRSGRPLVAERGFEAALVGMTLATSKSHIVTAVLQGIAANVAVLAELVEKDSGQKIGRLRVDGGLTRSRYLMQAVADMMQVEVETLLVAPRDPLGSGGVGTQGHRTKSCAGGLHPGVEPGRTLRTQLVIRSGQQLPGGVAGRGRSHRPQVGGYKPRVSPSRKAGRYFVFGARTFRASRERPESVCHEVTRSGPRTSPAGFGCGSRRLSTPLQADQCTNFTNALSTARCPCVTTA